MSDRQPEDRLAQGLLVEDARSRGPAGAEALLEKMVEHELASERRVRRAAIASWSVLLALLVLFSATVFTGGFLVDMGWQRLATMILYIVRYAAVLDLVLAILTTAAWLFRPRAASLALIERRLAALEELLRSGR